MRGRLRTTLVAAGWAVIACFVGLVALAAWALSLGRPSRGVKQTARAIAHAPFDEWASEGLRRIGQPGDWCADSSFSLYLLHWPMFTVLSGPETAWRHLPA